MFKKNKVKNNEKQQSREFIYKDDNTEYGLVTKKLGCGRFQIILNLNNKEVIGQLSGRLKKNKKQNFVDIDSVVLVGLRDFQNTIVDIIHVYDNNERKRLKKESEIFFEETKVDNQQIDNNIDEIVDFNEL